MADSSVSQNGHGFCDVDVCIRDGEAEWLYQVSKDLESGEISQSGPRYAASKDDDFDDGNVRTAPEHVSAEMTASYPAAVELINKTIALKTDAKTKPNASSGMHP